MATGALVHQRFSCSRREARPSLGKNSSNETDLEMGHEGSESPSKGEKMVALGVEMDLSDVDAERSGACSRRDGCSNADVRYKLPSPWEMRGSG